VAGVFFAAREMQILVERHRHGRHPLKSWQS
jgi:hypothetical protein